MFSGLRPGLPVACICVLLLMACTPASLMTTADYNELSGPPADAISRYGEEPLQFGQLRLPGGDGPFPVAIVVHGGCWLAEYPLTGTEAMSAALTDAGVATWNIEYRRIGDAGGGWPGTFEDVAAAADHLRELKERYPLDTSRVVATGRSSCALAGRPAPAAGRSARRRSAFARTWCGVPRRSHRSDRG